MTDRAIHRLHMASVNYLDGRIDVYAYLILAAPEVILIDTGVGEGHTYIERKFEPRRSSMTEELERIGLSTGDVTMLVNSHLHFDHCGNNRLFPDAEVFVQAAELEAAQAPNYTVSEWFDRSKVRTVDGNLEISPGIQLLASPGHTPGHQSVLVEMPGGPDLVVAQAAYTVDEFFAGGDPENQAHPGLDAQYRATISQLKSYDARHLYFSHDSDCALR